MDKSEVEKILNEFLIELSKTDALLNYLIRTGEWETIKQTTEGLSIILIEFEGEDNGS